ncbi:ATP-binding protein [Bacillus sp. SJS]|uniref:ATP-binding protein n=1 Tax=Bacillus sp. SJS TaxID=1423321 RepID=UPI0006922959|nr:ATP-binding protein [Bacillus sp. SJS]KZZ82517.1 hypothetical protein AS29_020715 [Bacillus sp. SJS]
MKVLKKMGLEEMRRKSLRHFVKELQNRDDYEIRNISLDCDSCGKEGSVTEIQYKISGDSVWKAAMSMLSECQSCRDQRELAKVMEDDLTHMKEERSSRLMDEYFLIPESLRNAGFKTYREANDVTGFAKRAAMNFTKHFTPGQANNLVFIGSPGTGKSHLCASIARTIKNRELSVGFLTTGTLLTKIKSTWKDGSSKTEEQILRDIRTLDLLILDDIGSESGGQSNSWNKKTLFEIVNAREGRPTVYTTNYTETDLAQIVGERVVSRLYTNSEFIQMFCEDYRKTLQI